MTREEAKCIIQDMLDDAEKYGDIDYDDLNGFISACQIAIKTLSDVPDTNVGKWIQHSIYVGSDLEHYYACSECDYRSWSKDNFCSVCGAKMEVEDETD